MDVETGSPPSAAGRFPRRRSSRAGKRGAGSLEL